MVPEAAEVENPSSEKVDSQRHRIAPWAIGAVLVAAAVALAAVGLPATVDGVTWMVRPGTTARKVLESPQTAAAAGDLVSAKDGRTVLARKGHAATLVYRGSRVATESLLWPFRAYGIKRGADIVEATRVETKTVEPKTVTRGDGPEETVIAVGRKGVSRTVYGAVSGDIVSSEWLVEGSPRIVQLSHPFTYAAPKNGVRGTKKLVALTFDDGPDTRYTTKILEILKRNGGIKATFFMLSSRAEGNPSLAKRVRSEGHLVANHSRTHRNLTTLPPNELEAEFRRSEQAIRHATGVSPKFYRAPYGATNAKVEAMAKVKKVHMVGWEVDSRDWTKPGPAKIAANATPVRNGGVVVLMHDSGGDRTQTIAALPKIIQTYRSRGYTFVTVDAFYR